MAVMGAGSVGTYIGGWLAAGADVTLVGRPHLVDAIERDGLTVTDLRGRTRVVRPDALTLATEASATVGAMASTKSAGIQFM